MHSRQWLLYIPLFLYIPWSQVSTRFLPLFTRDVEDLQRKAYQKPARKKRIKAYEIISNSMISYIFLTDVRLDFS